MWNPSRAPCPNSACWKKLTRSLIEDIAPLLPAGVRFNDDNAMHAFERVWKERSKSCAQKCPGLLSR